MKLLPCPFCGGEARWRYRKPIGWVMCKKCGASSATLSDKYEEADCQQEAIAAWNRRVDARQLALKTRVCPMCEDCPDGCPVETPEDSRNVVTNADRVFYSYGTDKEVLRVKCPVIRESEVEHDG